MTDANLVKYIKDNLAAGFKREDIISALLKVGWAQSLIDDGFAEIEKPQAVPMVVSQNIPPKIAKIVPPTISSANINKEVDAILSSQANATLSSLGTITSKENKSHSRIIVIALVVVGFVVLGSGTAYMYFAKIGPFSHPPYSENNLVQGILVSLARINTSSYALSGSLAVNARDADAKPFVFNGTDDIELTKQYQHDVKRAQDVNAILQGLNNSYRNAFPSSLKTLASKKYFSYYSNASTTDPVTNQPYEYTTTEDGKNFALTLTFDTDAAISQLRQSYRFIASTTPIVGRKVIFTKNSSSFLYLSSTPPKPFLAELSDSAAYLPAALKASLSAMAVTDWKNSDADWQFNVNADGDFGDLAYKVNVDVLKKDSVYYLKINNLPNLFFGSLETIKGKWAKIDLKNASSTQTDSFDLFSSIASQLPEAEKSYKVERQKFVDMLKKAASIADEEHLFTLKSPAKSERVDGRLLYRYDLKINKRAIASVYKRLISEAVVPAFGGSAFIDSGYIAYWQSSEFNNLFDYYDKNTSLTLWADSQGFPGMIKYSMRVVPLETATQLQGKQINAAFTLVLSNINQPVDIHAPKNAKSIQELIGHK